MIDDFGNVTNNNDAFRVKAANVGPGLVAGTLAARQFIARADNLAQDANSRFISRTADKTLWFDSNGNATGDTVLLADLQDSAVVTPADFLIV